VTIVQRMKKPLAVLAKGFLPSYVGAPLQQTLPFVFLPQGLGGLLGLFCVQEVVPRMVRTRCLFQQLAHVAQQQVEK